MSRIIGDNDLKGDTMVELNPEEMGAVVNRLRRAQGQIGGILRGVLEEGSLPDNGWHGAAVTGLEPAVGGFIHGNQCYLHDRRELINRVQILVVRCHAGSRRIV